MVFNLRTFSFTESVEDDPKPPKSFSLKEIRVATDNFSSNNFLGEDDFGKVYQGRLADGSLVAVKRGSFPDKWRREEFEALVQMGSTVSTHPNVLCLRGFCKTEKELLLVYPLMINKNLYYHLRERSDRSTRPLDWPTRKHIALGAARGLAHLHDHCNVKIIHHNICPLNILLNTQFEAVIGGFQHAVIMHDGNAKEGTIQWCTPHRFSSSSQGEDLADSDSYSPTYHLYEDVYVDGISLRGALAFVAPERLYSEKCTLKTDVFAYGILLFLLISGRLIDEFHVLASDENLSMKEWIGGLMSKNELGRVIDPNLQGKYVEEEAEQLVRLALLCADNNPSVRPKMSEVVIMIENQMRGQNPSSRSNWSGSEYDSTPYYSCDSTPYHSSPPSPSLSLEIC